jgi:hypothetical protein
MKVFATVLCVFLLVSVAAAQSAVQKIDQDPVETPRIACEFENICEAISFGADPGGFVPELCEPDGLPAWEWGIDTTIPAPPAPYGPNVWGTVLNGSYSSNTGDGLVSPLFAIDIGVNELVEWVHYVDIETNYDGGNVVVLDGAGGETVLVPMAGYPATLSTSTYYYAYCVDLEDGYTGHDAIWATACADLSPWDGEVIALRFDFGSDSSVTYPGWFLAGVTLGTETGTPVEHGSWTTIKALFR